MSTETEIAKPRSVTVVGRRWFEKTNGNTYNTASIYVDGVLIVKLPFGYGYGDHYVTRAEEALESLNHMPGRKHYPNGSAEPAWQYFRERGIAFSYEAVDVARKRDL